MPKLAAAYLLEMPLAPCTIVVLLEIATPSFSCIACCVRGSAAAGVSLCARNSWHRASDLKYISPVVTMPLAAVMRTGIEAPASVGREPRPSCCAVTAMPAKGLSADEFWLACIFLYVNDCCNPVCDVPSRVTVLRRFEFRSTVFFATCYSPSSKSIHSTK